MAKIATAQTQTPEDLPKGSRPEEFLRDADLVGFYERQADELKPGDKKLPGLRAKVARARLAALTTEANVAESLAEGSAELEKELAKDKG